jgi:hypothetical protein
LTTGSLKRQIYRKRTSIVFYFGRLLNINQICHTVSQNVTVSHLQRYGFIEDLNDFSVFRSFKIFCVTA